MEGGAPCAVVDFEKGGGGVAGGGDSDVGGPHGLDVGGQKPRRWQSAAGSVCDGSRASGWNS